MNCKIIFAVLLSIIAISPIDGFFGSTKHKRREKYWDCCRSGPTNFNTTDGGCVQICKCPEKCPILFFCPKAQCQPAFCDENSKPGPSCSTPEDKLTTSSIVATSENLPPNTSSTQSSSSTNATKGSIIIHPESTASTPSNILQ